MYLDRNQKAVHCSLVKWETEALEQMDIPFFTLRTDSTAIDLPNGQKLRGFCPQSGLDNVITKINSLREHDLSKQIRLSKSSLCLSAISGEHSTPENSKKAPLIDREEILSPPELIAAAKAIAEEIKARAIYTDDGSASWIAPQLQADRFIVKPLRLNLYQGVSGILVFLAALEKVIGDGNYRELIQTAALPLKDAIANMSISTLVKNGYSLGGYTGIGSLFIETFTKR